MFCLRSLSNSNILTSRSTAAELGIPVLRDFFLFSIQGLRLRVLSILGVGHSINLSPIFFVPSGSNIDTVEFAVIFASSCIFLENAKLSTSSSWRMWMPVNQVCSSEGQEHLLFRRPFKKFKYSALSLPLLKLEM